MPSERRWWGQGVEKKGERFSPNCITERDRNRGGSVCVWGAIGIDFRSDLVHFVGNVNAHIYIDEVINDQVIPIFQNRPNYTFMHDNARPHAALVTTNHLENLGIQVLPWPAKSPIEHICIIYDEIERRLRTRPILPNNL